MPWIQNKVSGTSLLFLALWLSHVDLLEAGHFPLAVPRHHFFLPSRALFYFRPDLFFADRYARAGVLYSAPVFYASSLCRTDYTHGIYHFVLKAPVQGQVVRANSADVVFNVNPSKALVYVDDKLIGSARDFSTTRESYRLLDGLHRLRIEFPGYEPFETEMEIVANRTLHLEIELAQKTQKR